MTHETNSQREIDDLATDILSMTMQIEPLAKRLDAAKSSIRVHAPCSASIDMLGIQGSVHVAAPPAPGTPRQIHVLADDIDEETLADLVVKGIVVLATSKPKKQTAAVTVNVVKREAL